MRRRVLHGKRRPPGRLRDTEAGLPPEEVLGEKVLRPMRGPEPGAGEVLGSAVKITPAGRPVQDYRAEK